MYGPILMVGLSYILLLLALGYMGRQRTRDTDDYWVGGRRLGPIKTGFTYGISLLSASGVVGGAGLAYGQGATFVLLIIFTLMVAFPLVFLYLGPKLRQATGDLGAVTVPGFLGQRYDSRAVHLLAAIAVVVLLIPLIVVQFRAAALILTSLLDAQYAIAVLITGTVATVYVSYGGYLSDVYSDVFQGIIMIIGLSWLGIAILGDFGGFSSLVGSYEASNPELLSPFGVLPVLAGMSVLLSLMVGTMGSPYAAVRFFSAADDRRVYGTGMVIAMLVQVAVVGSVLAGMAGVISFPNLENPDAVIYRVALEVLNPWVAGILLAAIMAALMSTADSIILVAASAVTEDVYRRIVSRPVTDGRRALRRGRYAALVIGLLATFAALDPPEFITLLLAQVQGVLGILLGVPLVCALVWKRFSRRGVWLSWIGALGGYLTAFLTPGFPVPEFIVGLVFGLLGAAIGAPLGRLPKSLQEGKR